MLLLRRVHLAGLGVQILHVSFEKLHVSLTVVQVPVGVPALQLLVMIDSLGDSFYSATAHVGLIHLAALVLFLDRVIRYAVGRSVPRRAHLLVAYTVTASVAHCHMLFPTLDATLLLFRNLLILHIARFSRGP